MNENKKNNLLRKFVRENALEPIHPRGMVAVATAFRELFDTEWTEAHEELDDDIDEKEKVQVLLEVVQVMKSGFYMSECLNRYSFS